MVRTLYAIRFRQTVERDLMLLEPLAIGPPGSEFMLDFFIRHHTALLQVDEQHLPRLQPPLAGDLFGRKRQNAGFRRHDQQPVISYQVSRRPQPVTVKSRADETPIGKRHSRGTVPWLY